MPEPRLPLQVWLFTPLGENGKGGIDRLSDEIRHVLRAAPRSDLEVTFVTMRGPGALFWSPLYLAAALLRTVIATARGRIGVAHIQLAAGGSFWRKSVLAQLLHLMHIPYILHIHGSDFLAFWDRGAPGLDRRIRVLFRRSAHVLVLGTAWQQALVARQPELAGRITVLANGSRYPAQAALADAESPHILFLGRLGARKGVPELIAALETLKPVAGWRATLAGDGDIDGTRSAIAARGLSDRVAVQGWAPDETVQGLLQDAAILALPSHQETLPMAVVEGFAHGLAVVTTPVGMLPEIITPDETGLLVAPGDVTALSAALARLLAEPALRARLGGAARAFHAQRLDSKVYVARLEELWRTLAR